MSRTVAAIGLRSTDQEDQGAMLLFSAIEVIPCTEMAIHFRFLIPRCQKSCGGWDCGTRARRFLFLTQGASPSCVVKRNGANRLGLTESGHLRCPRGVESGSWLYARPWMSCRETGVMRIAAKEPHRMAPEQLGHLQQIGVSPEVAGARRRRKVPVAFCAVRVSSRCRVVDRQHCRMCWICPRSESNRHAFKGGGFSSRCGFRRPAGGT